MSLQTTTRLTYDDLLAMPDDGKHYEIIDGELFVNAAPVPRHQRIVRALCFALHSRLRVHGGGEALDSPIDVVLSPDNVVEPDIIVIKSERASIVGPKNIQGAPNLVVEVLSDGSRRKDAVQKRKLYDRFGVDEYWIGARVGQNLPSQRGSIRARCRNRHGSGRQHHHTPPARLRARRARSLRIATSATNTTTSPETRRATARQGLRAGPAGN